jgi:hypothetical protein
MISSTLILSEEYTQEWILLKDSRFFGEDDWFALLIKYCQLGQFFF